MGPRVDRGRIVDVGARGKRGGSGRTRTWPRKHYLAVPDDLFDKAAGHSMMAKTAEKSGKNPENKTGSEKPVAVSACSDKYPRQGSNLQPSASENKMQVVSVIYTTA